MSKATLRRTVTAATVAIGLSLLAPAARAGTLDLARRAETRAELGFPQLLWNLLTALWTTPPSGGAEREAGILIDGNGMRADARPAGENDDLLSDAGILIDGNGWL